MKLVARLLMGFGALQIVGLLAPFIMLPIAARVAGQSGWAAIAVAQAVGSFAGIVAGLGWNVIGSPLIAQADPQRRTRIVADSLVSRAVALLVVGGLVVWITGSSAPAGFLWLAVTVGLAQSINALNMRWYYVGMGQVRALMFTDALPRLMIAAIGAITLATTRSLWVFPVALAMMAAVPLLVASVRATTLTEIGSALRPRRVSRTLRDNASITATEVIAGGYGAVPLMIAGFILPTPQVAVLGSADKFFKLAQNGVGASIASLTGWLHIDGVVSDRRVSRALQLHVGLGAVGGLAVAFLGPWATAVLFGEESSAGSAVMGAYGVAFAAMAVRASTSRLGLVPRGYRRSLLVANIVATAVCLPLVVTLAGSLGSLGVAVAVAAAELSACAVIVGAYLSTRNRPSSAHAEEGNPVED